MKYSCFEHILSPNRMSRYLMACNRDTRKSMTLYRYNLHLSHEMFTIISCFEIALRNAIDNLLVPSFGPSWLKVAIMPNGFLTSKNTIKTHDIVKRVYDKLVVDGKYSHTKLLSGLEFGVWKYMFSPVQFKATGRILLRVFPNKTRSSAQIQYNHSYVFNELDKVNTLRNRIAHHEPICFLIGQPVIDTSFIFNEYNKIQTLFQWMGIDSQSMLYGLDHVEKVCTKIELLKSTR